MSADVLCPGASTWQRFLSGRLAEEEAGALEEHLSHCSSCLSHLTEAQGDDDALVASCRTWKRSAESWPSTDRLEVLVQRLRELLQPAAGADARPTTSQRGLATLRPEITPGSKPQALPASIGRYRVVRLLGKGGMGTVYLAEDPELQRRVAVKVPRFTGPDEPRELQRFLREARSAAAVRHPHVCPIHDVGAERDTPYVVMAFIEGESLADRLKRGPFAEPTAAVRLALPVVEALSAVHAQGIIHRDLKPANILLDASGQALLSDFGLARPSDGEHLTAPGGVAGTPAYMAPEQVLPDLGPVSERTDIYSMGVVLYEMLTGQLPFQGTTMEVLLQLAGEAPPAIDRQRSDLDPALAGLINRALARRPDSRVASARQLADGLRAWLNGTCLPPVPAPAHREPHVSRPGRRWLVLGAVAVALLLGGSILRLVMRPSPTAPSMSATVLPFQGWIDVRVWEEARPERRGLRLADAGALPVKEYDAIRIEAQLNQPGYIYVVWIDSDGKAEPVYPWQAGNWETRPTDEKPVQRLSLPQSSDAGWPMGAGPAGMESLVMLARKTPLPRDIDLKKILADLMPQTRQHASAAVWFENGAVVSAKTERDRGPKFFDERRIEDPVLRTQRLIQERLQPLCDYSRAVCFARQ